MCRADWRPPRPGIEPALRVVVGKLAFNVIGRKKPTGISADQVHAVDFEEVD